MIYCQELNFIWMNNMYPVKKIKYDGPKNLPQIIKQIKKDSESRKYRLSEDMIFHVISTYFGGTGLGSSMRKGENIKISFLGNFIITREERIRRAKIEKRRLIRLEKKKAISKRKNARIMKARWRARKKLKGINEYRISLGKKPITEKEFKRRKNVNFPNYKKERSGPTPITYR